MNLSKGFLLFFSLVSLVSMLLIVNGIKGVDSLYFYVLVSSSILTYIFNMYVTYHIMYADDVQERIDSKTVKSSKSSKDSDDDSE